MFRRHPTSSAGERLLLSLLLSIFSSPRARGILLGLALLAFFGGLIVRFAGDSVPPWVVAACASAGVLILWIRAYRSYRLIADTPSAPIASAAQGFASISGIGRLPPGDAPLRSPLNYLPCLWYRVLREERDGQDWRTEEDQSSSEPFYLEDENGQRCRIEPAGARVETVLKDQLTQGDSRTTQWLLVPGTHLHAIGHFSSRNPGVDRPALREEVRDKLIAWKRSGDTRRFDLDGNGELDMQEWELARAAAQRETQRERVAASAMPDEHCLCKPDDGRPFLLADHPPEQFVRRLRWEAFGWLALFFGLVVLTAWLQTRATGW
jgi:hypothetical protein